MTNLKMPKETELGLSSPGHDAGVLTTHPRHVGVFRANKKHILHAFILRYIYLHYTYCEVNFMDCSPLQTFIT